MKNMTDNKRHGMKYEHNRMYLINSYIKWDMLIAMEISILK